jgi:hypothetical protein
MKLKSLLDFKGKGYTEPMDQEQSKALIALCMMERQFLTVEQASPETQQLIETDRACQIFHRRLKFYGVDVSPSVILLCSMESDGRPGTLVMWAYTCVHLAEKYQKGLITLEEFTLGFPMGFPTEKAKRECWELQKCKPDHAKGLTDNEMDNSANWVWEGHEKHGRFPVQTT